MDLDARHMTSSKLYYVPLFLTESLLPYRGKHHTFTRKYQQTHITIQGGADDTGALPLASGVIGRRILFHFITEAWLGRSPKVYIRGTKPILEALGITPTHANKRAVKKQLYWLSQMTIRVKHHFTLDGDKYDGFRGENIRLLKSSMFYNISNPEQLSLFDSWIEFSPEFYALLTELREKHPPIRKEPVFSLSGPLQTDLYCFLQRRLQNIQLSFTPGGFTLSWEALYEQFGRGERMQDFRSMVKSALKKVIPELKTHNIQFSDNTPVRMTKNGLVLKHIPRQVKDPEGYGRQGNKHRIK